MRPAGVSKVNSNASKIPTVHSAAEPQPKAPQKFVRGANIFQVSSTERLNRDAKNQRSAADEVFRPGVGVHGRRSLRYGPVFQQVRPQSSLHTQVVGQTALEVLAKDQASAGMAAPDRLAVPRVRQGSARKNPERGSRLEVALE